MAYMHKILFQEHCANEKRADQVAVDQLRKKVIFKNI